MVGFSVHLSIALLFGCIATNGAHSATVDTAWVRRATAFSVQQCATEIALGQSGHVYVAGSVNAATFDSSYDIWTVKYSSEGDTVWTRRYHGPGAGNAIPHSLLVDGSENVFVAGQSPGPSNWQHDIIVLRYNGVGTLIGTWRYNGPAHGNDRGFDMAFTPGKNVIVTGETWVGSSYDMITLSFDSTGVLQWLRSFGNPSNGDDRGTALAVDGVGNIFVTGFTQTSASFDYVTLKYDTFGNHLWTHQYDGPAGGPDRAAAIALAPDGGVYITGASHGDSLDYATIKIASDGSQQWVQRYNGTGSAADSAVAIAIDPSGSSIYVTGMSQGVGYDIEDYLTIKYDSAGTEIWNRRFNGIQDPPNGPFADDAAFDLAIDIAGDVYVTGYSNSQQIDDDCTTLKYSSNGELIWAQRYDFVQNSNFSYGIAIDVDSARSVYVAGWRGSVGAPTGISEFLTIKLTQCACSCAADPQCDGITDIVDVVKSVEVAFRAAPAIPDPDLLCHTCDTYPCTPIARTDVNCDGATDIVDVVGMIDCAFRGADPASVFCNPCGD